MLAIEVTNTLFQVVALLFKLQCNDTPSAFVTALLKKRDVTEMEQKSRNNGVLRFVGELYNYEVIELGDLKDRLIEPLLGKSCTFWSFSCVLKVFANGMSFTCFLTR